MAKNKGNRRLTARDFIITPRERMAAKLDACDSAIGVAAASSQDPKHSQGFYDTWSDAFDKLTK